MSHPLGCDQSEVCERHLTISHRRRGRVIVDRLVVDINSGTFCVASPEDQINLQTIAWVIVFVDAKIKRGERRRRTQGSVQRRALLH